MPTDAPALPPDLHALWQAAHALARAKHLLIATGAGMSADSGVPTYRDEQGMWRDFQAFTRHGLHPSDFAHGHGYRDTPELAWAFHEHIRRIVHDATPHAGYNVLTRLLATPPSAFLLTTNIDELHLRAGVPAHQMCARNGSLFHLQCSVGCTTDWWPDHRRDACTLDEQSTRALDWPRCPFCDATARPRIQMAHDPHFLPDRVALRRYERFTEEATPDVYLIIGTTLWFSWPPHAPQHPTIIHINPNPDTHTRYDAPIAITMRAAPALVALEALLSLVR